MAKAGMEMTELSLKGINVLVLVYSLSWTQNLLKHHQKIVTELNVFLTGATGFIGGEILYKLLNNFNSARLNIHALVRTESKGQLITNKTNGRITPVVGDLDSNDILVQEFERADVIVNAASNSHLGFIKTLEGVLTKKKTYTYFFQVSGASIIGTKDQNNEKQWGDITDLKLLQNLIDSTPHAEVERTIVKIQNSNPDFVRTVIIIPPTVFNTSSGYDHIYSSQIPLLIETSLKLGQVFTIGDGNWKWSHVNINYLGDLLPLLLNKLVEDPNSIKTGSEGFYFVSTGEHSWKDVSQEIAKILKEKGILETAELKQFSGDEIDKLLGYNYSSLWSTNAIIKPELARSYNWQTPNTQLFWKSIGTSVDNILKQQGEI